MPVLTPYSRRLVACFGLLFAAKIRNGARSSGSRQTSFSHHYTDLKRYILYNKQDNARSRGSSTYKAGLYRDSVSNSWASPSSINSCILVSGKRFM